MKNKFHLLLYIALSCFYAKSSFATDLGATIGTTLDGVVNNPVVFSVDFTNSTAPTCAPVPNGYTQTACFYRLKGILWRVYDRNGLEVPSLNANLTTGSSFTNLQPFESKYTDNTFNRTGTFTVKAEIQVLLVRHYKPNSKDTLIGDTTAINLTTGTDKFTIRPAFDITAGPLLQNTPVNASFAAASFGINGNYTVTWLRPGSTVPTDVESILTGGAVSNTQFLPFGACRYEKPGVYNVTMMVADNNITEGSNTFMKQISITIAEYASDLWMRDNPWSTVSSPGDNGSQPNTSGSAPWHFTLSPDLFVRSRNDFKDQFYATGLFAPGNLLAPKAIPVAERDVFNGRTYNNPPIYDFSKPRSNNVSNIYAIVRNRGNRHSIAGENKLRVFWTIGRLTEVWTEHWLYGGTSGASNFTVGNMPMGSEMTISDWNLGPMYASKNSQPISAPQIKSKSDVLDPNSSFVNYELYGPIPFIIPDPRDFLVDAQFNGVQLGFCIQARVQETTKFTQVSGAWVNQNGMAIQEDVTDPTNPSDVDNKQIGKDLIKDLVTQNNNIVTHNTYIGTNARQWNGGTGTQMVQGGAVILNNPATATRPIGLFISALPHPDLPSFPGTVYILMDNALFTKWQNGGSVVEGATMQSTGVFKLTGEYAYFPELSFEPNEEHFVGMKFDFDQNISSAIVGDYTFVMGESADKIDFQGSPFVFVGRVNVPGTGDEEGNGGGPPIIDPSPSMPNPALSVSPNPVTGNLNIAISNPIDLQSLSVVNNISESTSIEIYDNIGRLILSREISAGQTNMSISSSGWKSGIYMIKLLRNGTLLSTAKVIKAE